MKKNVLKYLAVFALFFATACQNNDSSKGTRDEEVKAFIGLWMEENVINPKNENSIPSYFSAVSIKSDLSIVYHSHYNIDDQKAPEITDLVTYRLVLGEHKVAQLKSHENIIENARAKGMPEDEIQKAVKWYNENVVETISLNEDNSQIILKSVYRNDKDKEPKTSEKIFIKITQEVYQKKASEYLDYANLEYNEQVRVFGIVSGHNFELIEKVTQTERNGKVEESSIKASEIQEESSYTSTDGTVYVTISAKNISFASSPKNEALINGKHTTRIFFFDSLTKGKFHLYFSIKNDDNKSNYSGIGTYGEVVINNADGIDLVQNNGSLTTIWRYRKVK